MKPRSGDASGKGYRTPADLKLSSDVMTPEVLWAFGRIGSVRLSPDGTRAVYDVTYFNKEENRAYTDLYVMTLNDGKTTRLTDTDCNEAEPAWTPRREAHHLHRQRAALGDEPRWHRPAPGDGHRRRNQRLPVCP